MERTKRGGDLCRHLGVGFEDEAERGGISADEYLKEFGQRMGYPLTAAQWIEARRIATEPDLTVISLARQPT